MAEDWSCNHLGSFVFLIRVLSLELRRFLTVIVYHTTPFIHMLDAGTRDQGEIPILNDLMLQEVG